MTAPQRFNVVFISRESRTGVSEGLNVLFADLIRSLLNLNHPVAIFTTERHLSGLKAVLGANGVDDRAVEIKAVMPGSRILNMGWSGLKKQKRRGLRTWLSTSIASAVKMDRLAARVAWLLDGSLLTLPLKLAWLALAAVSGVLAVCAAVLLLIVLSIPYFIYTTGSKLAGTGSQMVARLIRTPDGRPLVVNARLAVAWLRRFVPSVYEQLYLQESQKFAKRLKGQREVGTYFFHNAFEGYVIDALGQSKKKMVVFPDLVTAVFPTRYPVNWYGRNMLASMVSSVKNADAIVCYSNYVRDYQLARFLKPLLQDKRVEVIPQGFFLGKSGSAETSVRSLNRLVKSTLGNTIAQGEIQFGSFDYVLYPSVDRPHKNTLTLLRAVEELIRNHQANIKLVTTSHSASDELIAYIREHHLEREVIFMPSLSIERLNSVIEGALAVVHPSLAEGGDIFNFSRAASHGCPALLSDIRVSREMFERYGIDEATFEKWLFNPFSSSLLAKKILDVRARRSSYVNEQREALKSLSSYSFEDMAQRYYDVYCSI